MRRVSGFTASLRWQNTNHASRPTPRQVRHFETPMLKYAPSVNVYCDHVDHARDEHDEDEWQVQRVPKREEAFVRLNSRHGARSRKTPVDICKGRMPQSCALRCDSC